MTLNDIKNISIREYLGKIGINPTRENERRGMYHSPLREDKNVSFSVDFSRNLWFDHGLGKGGSIIDLVSLMENVSVADAIRKLENGSFSFHRNNDILTPQIKQEPAIRILSISALHNTALLDYLKEREIKVEVAKEHCREIYYSTGNKEYFAIGFQNNANGFELRNKHFKGCTNKDITIHSGNDKDTCLVFEGFIDYLSFLSFKGLKLPIEDVVILNSITNLPKALNFIQSHPKVHTYLDNDEAGRNTTSQIKSVCDSVSDQSTQYSEYKDLNDLLCGKKMTESKQAGLQERKLSGRGSDMQKIQKTHFQTPVKKKTNRRLKR